MRITVVLPFVNLTGGIRVMLDYARLLQEAGHQTTVVYPTWPYRFQWTRRQQWDEFLKTRRSAAWVPWMHAGCRVVRVPLIRERFLPDADVIIATAWPTALDVASLSPRKGRHVHIVMHHESGSGPEAMIRRIYALPAHRIAFSHFVQTAIESQFGCRINDVVTNGVDTRIYFPDGVRQERQVAMLYHPDPRKGAEDGLRALALVQQAAPRVTIRLCGTVHPAHEIPAGMSFEFHPSDADVRKLLSTSTALLYPSRYEGFGLPPLEAMACGCPVVTTDVGAIPEFVTDGVNGVVVPVGNVDLMAASLVRLLRDRALQTSLSTRGLQTADALSLDRVGPLFVEAIERLMTIR